MVADLARCREEATRSSRRQRRSAKTSDGLVSLSGVQTLLVAGRRLSNDVVIEPFSTRRAKKPQSGDGTIRLRYCTPKMCCKRNRACFCLLRRIADVTRASGSKRRQRSLATPSPQVIASRGHRKITGLRSQGATSPPYEQKASPPYHQVLAACHRTNEEKNP